MVDAVLRMAAVCNPAWWVIENPAGRLEHYLGPPQDRWDPCDFAGWLPEGERESERRRKLTYLWGRFRPPERRRLEPRADLRDWARSIVRSPIVRAQTPRGFALAFAKANP
jgi:hypothetical protein